VKTGSKVIPGVAGLQREHEKPKGGPALTKKPQKGGELNREKEDISGLRESYCNGGKKE